MKSKTQNNAQQINLFSWACFCLFVLYVIICILGFNYVKHFYQKIKGTMEKVFMQLDLEVSAYVMNSWEKFK